MKLFSIVFLLIELGVFKIMIDNDFYNIAKKMILAVSAPIGTERIINKGFWNSNGVLRIKDGKVYYPSTSEVWSAFSELAKNKIVKFHDYGGTIGITLLKEVQCLSTFSHSTRPNV